MCGASSFCFHRAISLSFLLIASQFTSNTRIKPPPSVDINLSIFQWLCAVYSLETRIGDAAMDAVSAFFHEEQMAIRSFGTVLSHHAEVAFDAFV
jgi:hypothetical protein